MCIKTIKSKYLGYKTDNFIPSRGETMKTTETLLKMAVLAIKPDTLHYSCDVKCYNLYKKNLLETKFLHLFILIMPPNIKDVYCGRTNTRNYVTKDDSNDLQ